MALQESWSWLHISSVKQQQGSANVANSWTRPIDHFRADDVSPWLKRGSCKEKASTPEERLVAWSEDFVTGPMHTLSNRNDLRTYSKIKRRELRESETIAMLLGALTQSGLSMDKLLENEYVPTNEKLNRLVGALSFSLRDKYGSE